MNDLRTIINVCVRCLNIRLTFAPYSFTILDFLITCSLIACGLYVMLKLLKD